MGSPTVNKGILNAAAGILEEIKGLKFKGKKAAAFGCYGWSGDSPKLLAEELAKAGFDVWTDKLGCLWEPDAKALAEAEDFGIRFATSL